MIDEEDKGAALQRLEHIKSILLAIRNVNQLIVTEDDPRRLIERACVNLTETLGYHNAWIALFGGEAARGLGLPTAGPLAAAAASGFDGGFEMLRERLDRGEFPDCLRRALEVEGTVVTGDPAADCADCPLHADYGGRAGFIRRLEYDGVTYGVLTASVPAAYANDAEEQDLFNEVADDLAFALHRIASARRHEQRQQRTRLVIEGSGLGTWEWNVQTNETVFNEQWAAMLGYTLEELTPYDYATWERLVHPDDLDRARQALADCVEGKTADYICEFRMKHKDGHWVWILDRGRVMTRDDAGKPLAMFGTHTDITEIKRAEEKARTERDLSQSIIDHGPLGITIVNRDGVVESANRLAQEILALSKSDIQGRTYNDSSWKITAVDGTQFPDEQLPVSRVLHTGEAVHDVQHAIEGPNAQRRILSINAAPLKNQEGHIDRIVCSIEDITDRKRAQEALAHHLRFEQAVAAASTRLLSAEAPESVVADALAPLLEASGVSRVYIFENFDDPGDGLCMKQTVEVCAPGVPPEIGNPVLQHVVYSQGLERWREALSAGNAIRGDVRDFPHHEREILESQGIVSILVLPLVVEGKWWGFIGFDETRQPRQWGDTEFVLLRTATEMLGAFFTRKQAEEALRDSEAYQRQMLQTTADGFWVLDTRGRFVDVNDAYCGMTGYERDEVLGMGINDLDADEKPAETSTRIARIMANGSEVFERRHRRKDGSVFPVEMSVSYLKERGGQFVCFCRDLTRRKQDEEAVREAAVRLDEAVRAGNVGLWDWDLATSKVRYSREWKEQVGHAEEEITDSFEEWRERVHPDDLPSVLAQVQKTIAGTARSYEVEFRFRHKDGSYRWILAQCSVFRNETGEAVRVLGSHVDLTDQKAREERVAILGSMLNLAPAGITIHIHDSEGRVVFANARSVALHGYDSLDEFLQVNLHDLDVPESEALLAERFRRIAEEGEARFEVSHYRKDGSIVPLEVLAKRIEWEGRPAILSIATDIAERKQAEQTLKMSEQRIQSIFRSAPIGVGVVDLASRVIMDANTMLCEIVGYSAGELIGQSARMLYPSDEEFERVGREKHAQIRDHGTGTVETRWQRKDGKIIDVLLSSATIDAEDLSKGMTFTGLDITERKRAEQEREQLTGPS